jgi:hypothetical protein
VKSGEFSKKVLFFPISSAFNQHFIGGSSLVADVKNS